MNQSPLVAIVMGSASDKDAMMPCKELFNRLEIPFTARVISAHRTPDECSNFAKEAESMGIKVIIAGAGAAAALPGALSAHTKLPVIGVPLNATPLNGLDALFAIAQMPGSTPVASMAIGEAGAKNAALLAARILRLICPDIKARLDRYQDEVYGKAKAQVEKEVY